MAIQDKFNKANVIYKITKDIDLGGETLTIPEGCTLDFQGGSFSNGELLNLILVKASDYHIFKNVVVKNILNKNVPIEWFGGYGHQYWEDVTANEAIASDIALKYAMISNRPRNITFMHGYYRFDETIDINTSQLSFSGNLNNQKDYSIRRKTTPDTTLISKLYFKTADSTFIKSHITSFSISHISLHGVVTSTAVELVDYATGVIMDCVQFYVWKRGIYRTEWDGIIRTGFNGNYWKKVLFSEIKEGCCYVSYNKSITANEMYYITGNTFIECDFIHCHFGFYLESTHAIVMNNFNNCNFATIGYDRYKPDVYNNYGCFAIKLVSNSEGTSIGGNYILGTYFEDIFPYRTNTTAENSEIELSNGYIIPTDDTEYSSIISYNCNLKLDSCYFTNVLKYFKIDQNTSLHIGDVRFYIVHFWMKEGSYKYNSMVLIKHSDITLPTKNKRAIIYNNSWDLSSGHFVTRLTNFENYSDVNDYQLLSQNTIFEEVRPFIVNNSKEVVNYISTDSRSITLKCLTANTSLSPCHIIIYLYYNGRYDFAEIIADATGSCEVYYNSIIYSKLADFTILYKNISEYEFVINIESSTAVRLNYMSLIGGKTGYVESVSSTDYDLTDAISIPIIYNSGTTAQRPSLVNQNGFRYFDATLKRELTWWIDKWYDSDGYTLNKKEGNTDNRPTPQSSDRGYQYFDSTLGKPIWWTGAKWVDATGAEV